MSSPKGICFCLYYLTHKNVISTEGGKAAAVESSLYFVVVVAFAVAVAVVVAFAVAVVVAFAVAVVVAFAVAVVVAFCPCL